jgi:hypothetical protein
MAPYPPAGFFDDPNRFQKGFVHLCVWVFYIFYETSILFIMEAQGINLVETGLNFALYAIIFYVNSLYLLQRFFARRRYLLFGAGLVVMMSAFTGIRYLLNVYALPLLSEPMQYPFQSNKMFWAQTLWRGGYFLMLSFGYWFALNLIKVEKQKREHEVQLRLLEKSLMEAEMTFLKHQINPHFLFNSLNFLYAHAVPHSESTAKGILLLSDIMRYSLKEEANGKVMLENEVQHLKNYIEINQLRFSNSLQIQFEEEGSQQFLMILPMVLITFVENCLKHGELFDPEHPLTILVRTTNNRLYFRTWNKKRNGPKEKSTGIGLANTRKRLDITYATNYTLDIDNKPDTFTCQLTLDL